MGDGLDRRAGGSSLGEALIASLPEKQEVPMSIRCAGLSLLLLLVLAPLAHAGVGFQRFTIPDPQGPAIEVGVWYPTASPALAVTHRGAATLGANAPIEGRGLPLVVISHGTGGHLAGHEDTAAALADAGFIVAALTHTGDNWKDDSRVLQIWDRTRQLKLLVDYMLGAWP
jgi:predicted dienelactone hydrolase